MTQKQGSSKKKREKKTSQGKHGGGGKVRLTALEKVLVAGGGLVHHTRKGQVRIDADRTKAGREAIRRAEEAAERVKSKEAKKKADAERRKKTIEAAHKLKV